jgi:catechol 2,3-dioxygenase-like lactoylglutathione lyase family enzyme
VLFPGGAPGDEARPSGATPIFTHPKETVTQLQFTWRRPVSGADEFAARGGRDIDPRYQPGWSSGWWAEHHSLGIERLAYLSIITSDPDQARSIYVDVLGGEVLRESTSSLTATDDVFVKVGTQTVIQLSHPHDAPSLARSDLDTNGSMLHAVAFQVADLDAAERHLRHKGIGVLGRDEHTIVADPADTFGAPYRFTTQS